jgi:8-amino-7-oxononanoate synthase
VRVAGWLSVLARKAELRSRAGLTRAVRPRSSSAVDLAGNDYLGLSRHPSVLAAASLALSEFGLGATGSRLVRGTTEVHSRLESSLASFMGTPSALVYSSGYLANLGAVRALASLSPQTVLIADAHVHASLVDGCRLAGVTTVFYDHASVASLRSVLASYPGRRRVVITESVFSVDGDLAPLPALLAVCRDFDALLLVDDAHGLAVVSCLNDIAGQDDVVVTATLSKALGGAGGVVAGPAEFVAHLVDTGRTFIFDTALPPSVAAGVAAALTLVTPSLSLCVRERAAFAYERLTAAGATVRPPAGGILSVQAPSAEAAVAWTDRLREKDIAVGCFRPPSTPDHTSRLRLTVNAGVDRAEFESAVEQIVETVS